MTTHTMLTGPDHARASGQPGSPSASTFAVSPLEAKQRRDFAQVRDIVDRSKVADDFDHLVVRRNPTTGKVMGRPRRLTLRALLVLAVLTCLRESKPTLVGITETGNDLPDDLYQELGLKTADAPRRPLTESQVGHLFNLLPEQLDSSPYRSGKRLKVTTDGKIIDEFKAPAVDRKCFDADLADDELDTATPTRKLARRARPALDDEQQRQRQQLLTELIDRLLQATLPEGMAVDTLAVDWTDREAYGKRPRKPSDKRLGSISSDRDAQLGRRRPKGNSFTTSPRQARGDVDGFDKSGFEVDKAEMYFGYLVHYAVAVPGDSDTPLPELALAMRMAPANDMGGVAPALIDMIDSVRRVGPVTHALVDRGYSMRTYETMHQPLGERGVHLTFDLAEHQRQRGGLTEAGAIPMAGDFYCPMLPTSLEVEAVPGPQATRQDWRGYHERRDARMQYAMRPKGRPTPDMASQRLQCPALAGRIRCPLRPESQGLDPETTPEIYESDQLDDVRNAQFRCCSAKSFTVTAEDGAGTRQRHPFGSQAWIRTYDQRTASERYIAHYKSKVRTGREDIAMQGLVRQTLMTAFASVAVNIRLVRSFTDQHDNGQ